MELEALQGINSEVRALGAQIVVLTPELERYTRALHKKAEPDVRHADRSSSKRLVKIAQVIRQRKD